MKRELDLSADTWAAFDAAAEVRGSHEAVLRWWLSAGGVFELERETGSVLSNMSKSVKAGIRRGQEALRSGYHGTERRVTYPPMAAGQCHWESNGKIAGPTAADCQHVRLPNSTVEVVGLDKPPRGVRGKR